jgi:hypothetical protein
VGSVKKKALSYFSERIKFSQSASNNNLVDDDETQHISSVSKAKDITVADALPNGMIMNNIIIHHDALYGCTTSVYS